jgi:hypothetical protein
VENDHVETVDRDRAGRLFDRCRADILGIAVLRPRVGLLLSGFAVLRRQLLPGRRLLRPECGVLRSEVIAGDLT